MLFRPTVPADAPDLMRVSAFQRQLDAELSTGAGAWNTRRSLLDSQLGSSLMQDLTRFERDGHKGELIEVLAACVRHGRGLLVQLQVGERLLPLTVFPSEGLLHMPLPFERFLELRLDDLRVLSYEAPTMRPPGPPRHGLARLIPSDAPLLLPLAPLLWELALRGSRDDLLPEIAGSAAYRIAPGLDLKLLKLTGTLAAAAERLQRDTCNLREIASWPGFDRQRAMRMLNGLYLQGGLIVSRSHPAASGRG